MQNGHAEAVKALLEAGEDPDKTPDGNTLLALAVTVSAMRCTVMFDDTASTRLSGLIHTWHAEIVQVFRWQLMSCTQIVASDP